MLGRYADALNDLDAGIRIEYQNADDVFSNGNVKPDEPTAIPCMWSQADVNKLAELFPKDYRTSLYVGLFQLEFSRWSADTDYQPILKAFEHAAELNPTSAVPSYFSAIPYLAGSIGGVLSQARATCLDDVVPRTKPCLELDDIHRIGVRYLTKAIAAKDVSINFLILELRHDLTQPMKYFLSGTSSNRFGTFQGLVSMAPQASGHFR